MELYSPVISSAQNEQRSYVQSQMKERCLEWLRGDPDKGIPGRPLPLPAEILKVMNRDMTDFVYPENVSEEEKLVNLERAKLSREEVLDFYAFAIISPTANR